MSSNFAREELRERDCGETLTVTETKMKNTFKNTAALACGLFVGGGAVQLLHAQSKPPAFVVSEIDVRDQKGYDENYLKATQKDISDHGGKYLAGGYNKAESLVGDPPPNRVSSFSSRTWTLSKPGRLRAPWTWRTPSAVSTQSFASMP